MKPHSFFTLMLVVFTFSGCTSMSGYDSTSEFACKAPPGILCESMSGVYANVEAHNLPSQRANNSVNNTHETSTNTSSGNGVMTRPIHSGTPIRSSPRILRIWFAPWEDTDGDLHDQSYVYLPVDTGHWLIEHNRRRIIDSYRPVPASNEVSNRVPADNISTNENVNKKPVITYPPDVNQSAVDKQQANDWMNGIVTPKDVNRSTQ